MALSNEEMERYSRHIILAEVGGKGQKKLWKPRLSNEEMERYSRHIILAEVGGKGQKKLWKPRC